MDPNALLLSRLEGEKAGEATEQETKARTNAAKTCKKLSAEQKAAFEAAYGTKMHAFGKCVSKMAEASGRDGPTLRGRP
jgi:hypothetical protein